MGIRELWERKVSGGWEVQEVKVGCKKWDGSRNLYIRRMRVVSSCDCQCKFCSAAVLQSQHRRSMYEIKCIFLIIYIYYMSCCLTKRPYKFHARLRNPPEFSRERDSMHLVEET
jgi:hypothetical protein